MNSQYPFFRDEDEQTQAVIGEDVIALDLAGTYQKPYAVLTQKRLYCKNERGNYITTVDDIIDGSYLEKYNHICRELWIGIFIVLASMFWKYFIFGRAYGFVEITGAITIISLICSIYFIWRKMTTYVPIPLILGQITVFIISLYNVVSNYSGYYGFYDIFSLFRFYELTTPMLCLLCFIIALIKGIRAKSDKAFVINCQNISFSFLAHLYPEEEIALFQEKLCDIKNKNRSL